MSKKQNQPTKDRVRRDSRHITETRIARQLKNY